MEQTKASPKLLYLRYVFIGYATDNNQTSILMTKSHLKYLFVCFICVFSLIVNAQSYTFRPLTMDNGLSNFVVNCFYKDSVGFIWIGTDNCLDRYDGVVVRHYPFSVGDINKKRVMAISESTGGQLFAGNGIGLWKLNKNAGAMELVKPEVIDCAVNALKWNSKRRELYIGTSKGLFVLTENNRIQHIIPHNNMLSPSNRITGIAIDGAGIVWLATRKGLCSFNPVNKKTAICEFKSVHPDLNVFHKITCIGKSLYMGTPNAGIVCYDISTSKFSSFTNVGSDIITDISSDGKDQIYVATDGNGVHFLSHKTKQIIQSIRYSPNQKTGIRSNSVYSLLVDRNGNVWIGFYQAGLDYSLYQNKLFHTYSFPPYFDSKDLPVRTFLIRGNEKLIGTREGLFYIQEEKRAVHSFTKSELRSNLVLSLCYHKGEYYIGTYGGGASVLNPQTMRTRPLGADNTLLKGHVFHFEEDAQGVLWIATSGGLFSYEKEKNELKSFTVSNSQLLPGNVFYVFFDSTKKGWIATENGLCIYDPFTKNIQANVFPKNFFNNEIIKVIHEDSGHKLFFCPDKGNIFVSDLNMKNYSQLEMTSRFQGRIFLSVLEDKNHHYWFGSDNGLLAMTGKDDSYYSLGFTDGIPDPVFNANAAFMDPAGTLWFGNAKGLLEIDPTQIKFSKRTNFPVLFTDLQVNGDKLDARGQEKFDTHQKINLRYNENNLKIQFVSLLYTNPAAVVYEYKLEGKDKEWQILPGGKNEVSYSNLSFGNYVFRVRLQGDNESEAQLKFRIHSYFTWVFWAILLVVLSAAFAYRKRFVRIYKRVSMNKDGSDGYKEGIDTEIDSERSEEKYKFAKLSEEECKQICEKLYAYLEQEKPYTSPDLKIVDLAQATHTSSHTLSYIFNQYLTKNYYDFINEYRVKEFQRLVSDVESSKYTLTALSEQCGFSSRASFFRSFKKLTGITPNEYIKNIGRNIQEIVVDH